MKLHTLRLRAIGPFADQVEIDFTRLGDSSLFLLEGPTGAGKSTVLDGISFALYGKVAQAGGSSERLHSHHARPDVAPEVELVFETRRAIYRVRRTPAFDKVKTRGAGTRRVNATVSVWKATSLAGLASAEPLSSRVAEADEEIQRAVGLTHEQFMQTAILPQGEFAHFLRAKSDDRRALLQRLFGTEVIDTTQRMLIEARREAERERASAQRAVTQAVQAFLGAAEPGPELSEAAQATADGGDPSAIRAVTTELLGALIDAESVARASAERARAACTQARAILEHARGVAGRRARRAELRRRLAALRERETELAPLSRQLARAERAEQLRVTAQRRDAALHASRLAAAAEVQARSALEPELRDADQPTLASAAERAHVEVGELAHLVSQEQALPGLIASRRDLMTERDTLEVLIQQATSVREALPDQIITLEHERDALHVAAAGRDALVLEQRRAVERVAAAERAVAAERALRIEAEVSQATMQAYLAQEAAVNELRISWRASVAGELGLALAPGDPCAVCGSVEHPKPAAPAHGAVSQQQLDQGEAESQRLRHRSDEAREQLAAQREALIALQLAADQFSPDQARAKLDEVEQQVRACEQAAEALVEADRHLAELADTAERVTRHLAEAEVALARLGEKLAVVTDTLAESRAQIDAARLGYPTVSDRRAALREQAELLSRSQQAMTTAEHAATTAAQATAAFTEALGEHGFTDESDWLDSLLPDAERATLRAEIDGVAAELGSVVQSLAEPDLLDPELDSDQLDEQQLVAVLTAAEAAEAEAVSVSGALQDRLAAVRRRHDLVERALDAGSAVLASTATAIRLGNLVAGLGDNQLRMELTSYVLIRRFAEVLDAANGQLRRISRGRYSLEHSDARTGNARSGLGMKVLDLHSGQARDPATLSGGETFYVSLALALGLAEIVRSESGGVDLGTLFVDEGFGSLDAEVLDEVLGVLDSLRAGGRSVGVVSHVAEMKARIADRIVISPRGDGTSTLRIVA